MRSQRSCSRGLRREKQKGERNSSLATLRAFALPSFFPLPPRQSRCTPTRMKCLRPTTPSESRRERILDSKLGRPNSLSPSLVAEDYSTSFKKLVALAMNRPSCGEAVKDVAALEAGLFLLASTFESTRRPNAIRTALGRLSRRTCAPSLDCPKQRVIKRKERKRSGTSSVWASARDEYCNVGWQLTMERQSREAGWLRRAGVGAEAGAGLEGARRR